jgi:hypothetical protein
MNTSTGSSTPFTAAIERMRAQRPTAVDRPTITQVRTIINGLIGCQPLEVVAEDTYGPYLNGGPRVSEEQAAKALLTGTDKESDRTVQATIRTVRAAASTGVVAATEEDGVWYLPGESVAQLQAQMRVIKMIADFGTWQTHVNGGSNAGTVNGADTDQTPLFQHLGLVDLMVRPTVVRRGKKFVAFQELPPAEKAQHLGLSDSQVTAILKIVANDGEQAGHDRIEEILESRERRSAVLRPGLTAGGQNDKVRNRRKAENDAEEQILLFGGTKKVKARSRSRRKNKDTVDLGPQPIVVPRGFERKAWHGRDVTKALAAIVVTDPDDETVARFISREYQEQAKVLTYEHLHLVWFYAKMQAEAKLEEFGAKNPVFAALAVEAFDTLDYARRDAGDALRELAAGNVDDLDALLHACAKAAWLAEGDLAKVERLIQAAKLRDTAVNALARELGYLSQRLKTTPARYLPRTIAELNAGQIRRIAAAAGLDVDNGGRDDERELRQRLRDYGFGADLDRLVPDGMNAIRTGRLDQFFRVMDARKDRDNTWHVQLRALNQAMSEELAAQGRARNGELLGV